VTVEVVKEVVQKKVNGATNEGRVLQDTSDTHTEVYFTSADVKAINSNAWSEEETGILQRECRGKRKGVDFVLVASKLPGRTDRACRAQWRVVEHTRSVAGTTRYRSRSTGSQRSAASSRSRCGCLLLLLLHALSLLPPLCLFIALPPPPPPVSLSLARARAILSVYESCTGGVAVRPRGAGARRDVPLLKGCMRVSYLKRAAMLGNHACVHGRGLLR
jgi:hypothetical protein